jgi:hypothetical protein
MGPASAMAAAAAAGLALALALPPTVGDDGAPPWCW